MRYRVVERGNHGRYDGAVDLFGADPFDRQHIDEFGAVFVRRAFQIRRNAETDRQLVPVEYTVFYVRVTHVYT